jgi:hypothetical protein
MRSDAHLVTETADERLRRANRPLLRAGLTSCRQRIAGVLLAAAAVLGATGSAHAAGPEFFGTNLQTLSIVAPAHQIEVLDQLAAGRMVVDRIQVDWSVVEPTAPAGGKHAYQWGGTDALIENLARRGMKAAPMFRYTPDWARTPDATKPGGKDELPPSAYPQFAALVAAFAGRYGTGGTFWASHPTLNARPTLTYEVWNETNLSEYAWNAHADPEAYAALLQAVRPALLAAQPNAQLLGSLAYQETEVPDFLPRLAAAGGLGALDAMGYHPYAPDALETIRLVQRFRAQLAGLGRGDMPIYANEAGQEAVVTNPDGSSTPQRQPADFGWKHFPSDASRAANLAFAGEALAASDCGVTEFLPYTVAGSETDNTLEKRTEAYMGLFRPATGAPTLTAQALVRASQRWAARFDAGGAGAPDPLRLCGGGASPDASLLTIDSSFTGTSSGCVSMHASYDGNPLEAVTLRLFSTAGAQVATSSTNAFGDATACVPWPIPRDDFWAAGAIDGAGRTGRLHCDIAGVGCPSAPSLAPGRGDLSAAAATGRPATQPKSCTWDSRARVVSFTPARGGTLAKARLKLLVKCDTAPKDASVRFTVLLRRPGQKQMTKVKTIWLRNGVERPLTLTGRLVNGHVVVVLHRPQPGTRIPQLRDTVTLHVTRPVKRR